jgi:hypothetical protein
MALSPFSNNLALARIDYLDSFIHNVWTSFRRKSLMHYHDNGARFLSFWRVLEEPSLDNTGLGIMRPARSFLDLPPSIHLVKAGVAIGLQGTGEVLEVSLRMFTFAVR